MVAASKMRKAQMRMKASRPYSEKIREVVGHLAQANPEYIHGFMRDNENAKSTGLIVVSTDKGLCGGLNTNVFRLALNKIREIESVGKKVEALSIGSKASAFLARIDISVVASFVQIGDAPDVEKLNGALKVIVDRFLDGELDEIFICYNNFVNTMKQEPNLDSLLPLSAKDLKPVNNYSWDYIYEPDAISVIDDLLLRYVEALIYQAVVENLASEQSARMVAMKAATDNAGNVIDIYAIEEKLGLPCFVKPNRSGSSYGIVKVYKKDSIKNAIKTALKEDDQLIIESELIGMEISVGAYLLEGEIIVLPITEIISKNDFFDYDAKYNGKSQEITPARMDETTFKKVNLMVKKIYSKLNLKGVCRSEFIIVDGTPHLLEINTIPGMTSASLIPQQVKAAGIELGNFFESLLSEGIKKPVI